MENTKIRALLIEPMAEPKEHYIEPSIKAFRKAVDAHRHKHGGIEAKRLEKNIYAIFNKDRFLADIKPNRRMGDDIISGNILIIAIGNNRLPVSLDDEHFVKYALRYWNTETFDDMDVMESNLNVFFSRFLTDEES